ncbi:hypothetical protein MC885_011925 [Smutsia gigantea]|nr:hypothetical protein MC885_011925 [Smutsia gigantea]
MATNKCWWFSNDDRESGASHGTAAQSSPASQCVGEAAQYVLLEMREGGLDSTKRFEVCNGPFLPTPSLAHYPVNTNAAFRVSSLLPTLKLILTYRRRWHGWKRQGGFCAPHPSFSAAPHTA